MNINRLKYKSSKTVISNSKKRCLKQRRKNMKSNCVSLKRLLNFIYIIKKFLDKAKKKICEFPVSRPYLAIGRRNPDPKLFIGSCL